MLCGLVDGGRVACGQVSPTATVGSHRAPSLEAPQVIRSSEDSRRQQLLLAHGVGNAVQFPINPARALL